MNDTIQTTKELLKFNEFCDMCKEYIYIGICYGTPGVGKTFSALHYTKWDIIERLLPPEHLVNPLPIEEIALCDSIFYTAPITASSKRIENDINKLIKNLNWLVSDITTRKSSKGIWDKQANYTKLIVIDEADRLTRTSIEQVRDIYDRTKIGTVLIGMPGMEKKLSRFPQLYSRVGFVHNFKPIGNDEIDNIIISKIIELDKDFNLNNESDKEAFSEIVKITRGNFRIIERLFAQIERVMKVNDTNDLKLDIVELARESLIVGTLT
jgi:hypothetical protein